MYYDIGLVQQHGLAVVDIWLDKLTAESVLKEFKKSLNIWQTHGGK